MPTDHTELETRPNISTEHQRDGDARHPSDTLDRGQQAGGSPADANLSSDPHIAPDTARDGEQPRDRPEPPNHTPGGNKQEAVEDRPNVSTVTPEDYPKDERAGGGVSGGPTAE